MADRTKLWIADQMKNLMRHKPIEKIRITEICKEAEIERSTFYYHFKDKYDLVAWIFYYSAYQTDIIDEKDAANSLKKMKSDFFFYKRAFEDTSQNALWQYMLEYYVYEHTRIAKDILKTDRLETQIIFSIRLYCYGAVGMSREWILNDNMTSAETVVKMMFASMPNCLRTFFNIS